MIFYLKKTFEKKTKKNDFEIFFFIYNLYFYWIKFFFPN
jgi:hypothetical protein